MWVCEDKDIKETYLEKINDRDLEVKLKFIKILSGNSSKTEQILVLAAWPPEACDFKQH